MCLRHTVIELGIDHDVAGIGEDGVISRPRVHEGARDSVVHEDAPVLASPAENDVTT
jgi:hypothetical protein